LKAELECENKDDRIAYLEEQIDMLRFRGWFGGRKEILLFQTWR
jgi:hypothetical protein